MTLIHYMTLLYMHYVHDIHMFGSWHHVQSTTFNVKICVYEEFMFALMFGPTRDVMLGCHKPGLISTQ